MSDNSRIDLREKYPTVFAKAFDVAVPEGWEPLVDRLIARILGELPPELQHTFQVSQAKEKLAELRISSNGDDEIRAMIEEATEESKLTCQICGQPGRPVNVNGWYAVLCEVDEAKERAR